MSNPVNKQFAALPANITPMVDQTGKMSGEWYYFFLSLWSRTGGAQGTVDSAAGTAAAALARANEAFALATLAESNAQAAQVTASQAISIANGASQSVAGLTPVAFGGLQKAENLSDLTDTNAARGNLGVINVQLPFFFGTATGQAVYMPIPSQITLPANLSGTITYVASPPSSAAVFLLQRIARATGAVSGIGSISLTAGSATAATLSGTLTTLLPGDTLQIIAPISSAANIGITLRGTL